MNNQACRYAVSWGDFLKRKFNVIILLLTFIVALGSLLTKKEFLKFNETRNGSLLHDHVLVLFHPADLSPFIFTLTYGSVIFGILICFLKPWRTIHLFLAIFALVVLRIITMYLFPLDPPTDIIPLDDPFLQSTFYSNAAYVKDLFFSGHTASVFMLFLLTRDLKLISKVLLANSVLLGCLLLVQHVHYTIDVIAAFPFCYLAFLASVGLLDFIYEMAYQSSYNIQSSETEL